MGVEAIGLAVGNIAGSLGRAASVSGPKLSAPAFEAAPAVAKTDLAMVGLEARFGPVMRPADIGPIVNEGPVAFADLKNTMPLQIRQLNQVREIRFNNPIDRNTNIEPLSVSDAITEAEGIISQAQKPGRYGYEPGEHRLRRSSTKLEPQIVNGMVNQTEPTTTLQSVLQQQEVEKVVTERDVSKQINTVEEEETEEARLKEVVDEEVLNTRIKEFGSAVDIVGTEVKEEGLEEIDGKKIVEHIPAETEANRSGLIKKQGPDGSREETIGEVSSGKFMSVKEAKEKIAAIIAQKVPVKRAKEGILAGHEAVARVLKYFFVKSKPVDQLITRVIKKQNPLQGMSVAKSEIKEPRIEDLGLAEVFPKTA